MRLREELTLHQARISGSGVKHGVEEAKVKIQVRAKLTEDVAFAFGCHDVIYAGSVPRTGVGKIDLEGTEAECEFHLKGDSYAFDAVSDSIGKFVAKMEGTGPELHFQINLTGYAQIVGDLADHIKCDPFEMILKPNQRNLDLQKAKEEAESGEDGQDDGDEGEGEGEESTGEGEESTGETAEDPAGPALVSAQAMGGTPSRARNRRAPRRPEEEARAQAEAGAAAAEQDDSALLDAITQE